MLDCQNWTLPKINLLPGKSTKYGSNRFKRIVTKNSKLWWWLFGKKCFVQFLWQKKRFFYDDLPKNDHLFFSKNCHFQMVGRNLKNHHQFLDITLINTSVEVEVDPKSSLGLDRFSMNVHPSFREILCIFTDKYRKIRISWYWKVTVLAEKENSMLKYHRQQ